MKKGYWSRPIGMTGQQQQHWKRILTQISCEHSKGESAEQFKLQRQRGRVSRENEREVKKTTLTLGNRSSVATVSTATPAEKRGITPEIARRRDGRTTNLVASTRGERSRAVAEEMDGVEGSGSVRTDCEMDKGRSSDTTYEENDKRLSFREPMLLRPATGSMDRQRTEQATGEQRYRGSRSNRGLQPIGANAQARAKVVEDDHRYEGGQLGLRAETLLYGGASIGGGGDPTRRFHGSDRYEGWISPHPSEPGAKEVLRSYMERAVLPVPGASLWLESQPVGFLENHARGCEDSEREGDSNNSLPRRFDCIRKNEVVAERDIGVRGIPAIGTAGLAAQQGERAVGTKSTGRLSRLGNRFSQHAVEGARVQDKEGSSNHEIVDAGLEKRKGEQEGSEECDGVSHVSCKSVPSCASIHKKSLPIGKHSEEKLGDGGDRGSGKRLGVDEGEHSAGGHSADPPGGKDLGGEDHFGCECDRMGSILLRDLGSYFRSLEQEREAEIIQLEGADSIEKSAHGGRGGNKRKGDLCAVRQPGLLCVSAKRRRKDQGVVGDCEGYLDSFMENECQDCRGGMGAKGDAGGGGCFKQTFGLGGMGDNELGMGVGSLEVGETHRGPLRDSGECQVSTFQLKAQPAGNDRSGCVQAMLDRGAKLGRSAIESVGEGNTDDYPRESRSSGCGTRMEESIVVAAAARDDIRVGGSGICERMSFYESEQNLCGGGVCQQRMDLENDAGEWSELGFEGRSIIENALAPSTRRRYKAAWKIWENFCTVFELPLLDVSMDSLVRFAAYIIRSGQEGSWKTVKAAVKERVLAADMPWPSDQWKLKRVDVFMEKNRNRLPKQDPFTPGMITQWIAATESTGDKRAKRFWARDCALLILGVRLFLRPGELAALRWECVTLDQDRLIIELVRTKTAKGAVERIPLEAAGGIACPVARLLDWGLLGRECGKLPEAGLVFPGKSGAMLSTSTIGSIVKKAAEAIGKKGRYGARSLRIGGATAAAQAGVPLEIIRAIGRWKQESTALIYIRREAGMSKKVTNDMGFVGVSATQLGEQDGED